MQRIAWIPWFCTLAVVCTASAMPSIVAVQAVSGVSAAAPTSAAMTATNTAVEDARATASSVQPFFPFSAPSHESDGFKSTEELVIWVEAAKNASDSSHGLAQAESDTSVRYRPAFAASALAADDYQQRQMISLSIEYSRRAEEITSFVRLNSSQSTLGLATCDPRVLAVLQTAQSATMNKIVVLRAYSSVSLAHRRLAANEFLLRAMEDADVTGHDRAMEIIKIKSDGQLCETEVREATKQYQSLREEVFPEILRHCGHHFSDSLPEYQHCYNVMSAQAIRVASPDIEEFIAHLLTGVSPVSFRSMLGFMYSYVPSWPAFMTRSVSAPVVSLP